MRSLWNDYDPLGVMCIEPMPVDEYESYCGSMLRLLENNATRDALVSYVLQVISQTPPAEPVA